MVKVNTGRKLNKSKRGASRTVKRSKSIKPKTICKRNTITKRGPKKMKIVKKITNAKVNRRNKNMSACRKNRNSVKQRSKSRSSKCKQNKKSLKLTKRRVNQRSKSSKTRNSSSTRSSKNRKCSRIINKCRKKSIKKGPKRPRSAYIFFFKDEFDRVNKFNKISKVSVFAKNAGQKWRNLNKAEKLNYNKMAENDLKRYYRLTRGKC